MLSELKEYFGHPEKVQLIKHSQVEVVPAEVTSSLFPVPGMSPEHNVLFPKSLHILVNKTKEDQQDNLTQKWQLMSSDHW